MAGQRWAGLGWAGLGWAGLAGLVHSMQPLSGLSSQGTEAGGHTGDIATSVLIPQCVDAVQGRTNFFGRPITVVAAGGTCAPILPACLKLTVLPCACRYL